MFGRSPLYVREKADFASGHIYVYAGRALAACRKQLQEVQQGKMRKEIPGAARITSPGSTMILLRRALRESNPWNQTETAVDVALGHRYSCCGSTWFDRITDYHFKIYHDPDRNIR